MGWGWGVSNIKSPCNDNLPFYAFGSGVGGVLVGVCEHVTCESAAVEVKIRQDGSQDGLFCFFCLRFHAPGTLSADILLYHDVHLLVCLCLPVGFVFLV